MKIIFLFFAVCLSYNACAFADYDRNKAVPVEKVLFGHVQSVRHITEKELIRDRDQGWKVFQGALLGGVIGHQFGSGHGRDIATILGAVIGGSIAGENSPKYQEQTIRLIELIIKVEQGDEFLVVQDLDPNMSFKANDAIRMLYLKNGFVRIDMQY